MTDKIAPGCTRPDSVLKEAAANLVDIGYKSCQWLDIYIDFDMPVAEAQRIGHFMEVME